MKASDIFPDTSNLLKADDLAGREHTVVLDGYEVVEFKRDDGSPDPKVAWSLRSRQKRFVANKTNTRTIAAVYGDDLDDWIGKEVVLYPTKVDFAGKQVDAIRVRIPLPAAEDDGHEPPF